MMNVARVRRSPLGTNDNSSPARALYDTNTKPNASGQAQCHVHQKSDTLRKTLIFASRVGFCKLLHAQSCSHKDVARVSTASNRCQTQSHARRVHVLSILFLCMLGKQCSCEDFVVFGVFSFREIHDTTVCVMIGVSAGWVLGEALKTLLSSRCCASLKVNC